MQLLHRLAMVGTARGRGLDALAEVVLDTVDHERCVVDGIHLSPCQGKRILAIIQHETVFLAHLNWAVHTIRARPCTWN